MGLEPPAEAWPRVEVSAATALRLDRRLSDAHHASAAMRLYAHRDWAGPDEGLYGYANDAKLRHWHAAVKAELGIEKPSAVTKAALAK